MLRRHPSKRLTFKTSFFRILAVLLICVAIPASAFAFQFAQFYHRIYQPSNVTVKPSLPFTESNIKGDTKTALVEMVRPPAVNEPAIFPLNVKPMAILLVGVDGRPGETQSRSDSIVLAAVNPKAKKVTLIPIPRDTYAPVPGYGSTKINHAMFYGGIGLLEQSLSNFLKLPIDRYLVVDFHGFQKAVDDIGGLTIDVEKNMDYDDPTDQTHIHLKKGSQHLTGDQVLGYTRFRHDAEADTGRMRRQQQVLKLMAANMQNVENWPALFRILSDMEGHMQTDMAPITLYKFARVFQNQSSDRIETVTIDGVNQVSPADDLWYFFVKEEERRRIANLVHERLQEES